MRNPASRAQQRKRRGRSFAALLGMVALLSTLVVAAPGFAEDGDDDDEFKQWENATFLNHPAVVEYTESMVWITHQTVEADRAWDRGYTGRGVDIAMIDTGVVPVEGLTTRGKIINGPDLSFESQAKNLLYLDTYGHGTHLAGLVAGLSDDVEIDDDEIEYEKDDFMGIAPEARIVNLKVADSQGAVDVSQVIAAIDWTIQHRNDKGLDIKILLLAYGTDSSQAYEVDPLAHIIQKAWDAGIVVVVAAGNDGGDVVLRNPASNPYVIAVGAADTHNTTSVKDDTIPEFSNCGTNGRHVDVVAPGKSVISLRNPGSRADVEHPDAVVGDDLFLGSGTSQAAAIVAGGAALILDRWPTLTPDQVKWILMDSATSIPGAESNCQGAGMINLDHALRTSPPYAKKVAQAHTAPQGTGSLESARGNNHVADNGVVLEGEMDIMGNKWSGYCDETKQGTTCVSTLWQGGDFNGASWSGASWSGASWSGASWSGASWSGASWSGASWSSKTWSGASWSGASWSGASWSGASWSGASWSGASWNGLSWN